MSITSAIDPDRRARWAERAERDRLRKHLTAGRYAPRFKATHEALERGLPVPHFVSQQQERVS